MVYAAAPADNPLKGFFPYQGTYTFPHSQEWFHMRLSEVQTDYNTFNWEPLDKRLTEIAGRGHQARFSAYLDYPGQPTGVPTFLSQIPRQISGSDSAADYNHPDMQRALLNYIAALGARYDGDPRVASITMGLLGFWGEWHTYPYSWMPSDAFQNQVADTYARAFPRTLLMAREPKPNINLDRPRLGFDDGSFAYDTNGPTSWHFWPKLKAAGLGELWRTRPIGGEIFPDVQGCLLDIPTCAPAGQEFGLAVTNTHASWMLYHGIFTSALTADKRARAIEAARSLGYTLHIPSLTLDPVQTSGALRGTLTVENRGVAPFYYPWPVKLGVLDGQGNLRTWSMTWDLRTALPSAPTTWSFDVAGHGLAAGSYTLLMGVPNPMASGRPLRFANSAQDQNLDGWLSLGGFVVRP